MFYSCPSVSAEAFFEAVSNQLAGLEAEGSPYAGSLESQLDQTIEVAQAVQASPSHHQAGNKLWHLLLTATPCKQQFAQGYLFCAEGPPLSNSKSPQCNFGRPLKLSVQCRYSV